MNRGAFDFIKKPIDFKDLEITIQETHEELTELKKSARSGTASSPSSRARNREQDSS